MRTILKIKSSDKNPSVEGRLLSKGRRRVLPFMIAGVLVAALLMQSGCSAKITDETKEKQERLAALKEQALNLNQEIAELEASLKDETSGSMVAVTLQEVVNQDYKHFVDVMGEVQSDQNLLVSPESSGNIVSILVKEGDKVTKGQVLAKLNTDALDRSIQEMEVSLDLARTLFERQETLWKQNIGSEVQYLQAKSNKESLEKRLEGLKAQKEMAVITSPVNGVVDELIQKRGEIAGPSMPFARVVNLDQVYITADVSEVYLNKVKKGDLVEIEFPVLGKTMEATIARTASVIDPDNRTFRIRVELPNKDGQIRPNLMAVLKLCTYRNAGAIVVPSLLVKTDFTGQFIFVANEENGQMVARKKYIESGLKDNSVVLIDSGLEPGMNIITEGFAQVVDGTILLVNDGAVPVSPATAEALVQ